MTMLPKVLIELLLGHLGESSFELGGHGNVDVQILHVPNDFSVVISARRLKHGFFIFGAEVKN